MGKTENETIVGMGSEHCGKALGELPSQQVVDITPQIT